MQKCHWTTMDLTRWTFWAAAACSPAGQLREATHPTADGSPSLAVNWKDLQMLQSCMTSTLRQPTICFCKCWCSEVHSSPSSRPPSRLPHLVSVSEGKKVIAAPPCAEVHKGRVASALWAVCWLRMRHLRFGDRWLQKAVQLSSISAPLKGQWSL